MSQFEEKQTIKGHILQIDKRFDTKDNKIVDFLTLPFPNSAEW